MNRTTGRLVAAAAACVASLANAAHRHGPPCATDPRCFRASEAVLAAVADARWVLTIRDAGSMMATRAGGAVRSFLSTLASGGRNPRVVEAASLLGRAGTTPAEGFAILARREIRIAIHDDGEWVAFAKLDPTEQRKLLATWKPSVETGGTLVDRPTGVRMASRDGWLVLASGHSSIPETLPEGWAVADAPADPQADSTVARIEAVARRPCGGDPLRAVGECEGERLAMRLRFRACDRDPFPGPVPGFDGPPITIDANDVERLAADSILCEIASMRTGAVAEDGPVLAELPETRVPATFRQNLGPRRLVSVGEVDGRRLGMRCPALAVACEVEDPEQAGAEQDSLVLAALAGLRRQFGSDPEAAGAIPDDGAVDRSRRVVDLEEPIARFVGRSPWFSAVQLSWSVVDGPGSDWQVYATHPQWRDRVAARLASMGPCENVSDAGGNRAVSVGRFNGELLARHLEGWLDSREQFEVSSGRFWDEIALCARLAHHVPWLGWKATRHGPAILVEFEARLAEP